MRINPLNFFNRELNFLPDHFVNTLVRVHDYDVERMRKWIYQNCRGRYSITKDVQMTGNQSRNVTVIGFEEPGDLTLFALSGVAQNNQK